MALTKVIGAGIGTVTNQFDDANMSAGSVLQVVHNSNASDVALTNDTSTFSTAVTADITPSATSSKILILLEGAADVQNGNYRAINWRILRDSTQVKTM